MSRALGEMEALALKAARGCGMSWGLAEEAGKALRYLEARSIPAAAALAELLEAQDGEERHRFAPLIEGNIWCAPGGILCPISTGAALNDFADLLRSGHNVHLKHVAYPVFLLPFAQTAAQCLGLTVRLDWPEVVIHIRKGDVYLQGPKAVLLRSEGPALISASNVVPTGPKRPASCRGTPPEEAIARLNALAHRTYAPATESSRLRGAGAGSRDID